MTRRGSFTLTCALLLGLCVAGCDGGEDDPEATATSAATSATPNAEESAVVAAYTAFLAEKRAIQNSGTVPPDAYADTAADVRREGEVAIARQYAKDGLVRVGRSQVKEPEVIDLTADTATLLICENEDDWGFKPKDEDVQYSEFGWKARGIEMVKVEDRWLVADGLEQDRLPPKPCGD